MAMRRHSTVWAAWVGFWTVLLMLCMLMELGSFAKGEIVIKAGDQVNFNVHCWAYNSGKKKKDYGSWNMGSSGMNRMGFGVTGLGSKVVVVCHFILYQQSQCGQIFQEFPIFPQNAAMIDCPPFDCEWTVLPDGFYYNALSGQRVKKFEWLCEFSNYGDTTYAALPVF